MKFYVGEEELGCIISHYIILDNNMYVWYLDDKFIKIENATSRKIREIDELMLKQLKDRNDNFNMDGVQLTANVDVTFFSLLLMGLIGNGVKNKDISGSLIFLSTASMIYLFSGIYSEVKKINDVKKAKLFFDMYSELQSFEGKLLVSSMLDDSSSIKDLTANTLDYFSYRDVSYIHRKIKKR